MKLVNAGIGETHVTGPICNDSGIRVSNGFVTRVRAVLISRGMLCRAVSDSAVTAHLNDHKREARLPWSLGSGNETNISTWITF